MDRQIKKVVNQEPYTRAEHLREIWQRYFESQFSVTQATKAELGAIRRGRAEFKRGEYVSLKQLQNDSDS